MKFFKGIHFKLTTNFQNFWKKIDLSNCLMMDFWEQCNQYITDLLQYFPADRVIPALIYIGKQVRRAKIHSSLSTCGDWFLYRAYMCTQALWACLAAFRLLFHTGDGLISPSSKAIKWAIQRLPIKSKQHFNAVWHYIFCIHILCRKTV